MFKNKKTWLSVLGCALLIALGVALVIVFHNSTVSNKPGASEIQESVVIAPETDLQGELKTINEDGSVIIEVGATSLELIITDATSIFLNFFPCSLKRLQDSSLNIPTGGMTEDGSLWDGVYITYGDAIFKYNENLELEYIKVDQRHYLP